jgi:hypothetical protein
MKFLLLVYIDEARIAALPEGEFDRLMRGCFESADALRRDGVLIDAQQLEPVQTARAIRRRDGDLRISDGPFAETKELLAGFNLIEAPDLEAATRIAEAMPWTALGCIEVRPVRDMDAVRARVGA